MKPLFLSDPVRKSLGDCLRPGGAELTTRMLELTRPEPNHFILDAGCGAGGTLNILARCGFTRTFGIDRNRELLQITTAAHKAAAADLSALPLADHSCNLVVCECAWNLTDKPATLLEFNRVLRPGSLLALSDIYLRRTSNRGLQWPVQCCFEQAGRLDETSGMIENAGFGIIHLEDMSTLLTQTAAEFVFKHGSLRDFWMSVTGDKTRADQACAMTAHSRPGLFLLLARTSHQQNVSQIGPAERGE